MIDGLDIDDEEATGETGRKWKNMWESKSAQKELDRGRGGGGAHFFKQAETGREKKKEDWS